MPKGRGQLPPRPGESPESNNNEVRVEIKGHVFYLSEIDALAHVNVVLTTLEVLKRRERH